MTSPDNGSEIKPMQASATRIEVDSQNERAEEFDLGSGTIVLAGKDQMIVAESVLVRGLWDDQDELYGLQMELRCQEDQLLILRQYNVVPETVRVEDGTAVKMFFEMESDQVESGVLSELGDAQNIAELFLAEDRFPPILNLQHYELQKIEIAHEL